MGFSPGVQLVFLTIAYDLGYTGLKSPTLDYPLFKQGALFEFKRVGMTNPDEALLAIDELDGAEWYGRTLRVSKSNWNDNY